MIFIKKASIGITILIIAVLFESCRTKMDCPAFNREHVIMNWYFGPVNGASMTFNDVDANLYVFSEDVDQREETSAYEIKCRDKCACSNALLKSTYYNAQLNYRFIFEAQHYDPTTAVNSSVQFDMNGVVFPFDVSETDFVPSNSNFTAVHLDSLTLLSTLITDVYEVDYNGTSQSNKFWLKYGEGIKGFEINGETFVRI